MRILFENYVVTNISDVCRKKSIMKPHSLFSFFFFLDLISTPPLPPDNNDPLIIFIDWFFSSFTIKWWTVDIYTISFSFNMQTPLESNSIQYIKTWKKIPIKLIINKPRLCPALYNLRHWWTVLVYTLIGSVITKHCKM